MDALADPAFFRVEGNEALADDDHKAALSMCLSRWSRSGTLFTVSSLIEPRSGTHFGTGKFKMSLPMQSSLVETCKIAATSPMAYWTNPLSFAVIPERAPDLLKELQKAELTIFKGDLNYRKLTR